MRPLLALVLWLCPVPVVAQGWIEPPPGLGPRQEVERVRSSVTVRVDGRAARVEVEEWFRNAGHGQAEGDYLFPLPGDAVFSDFSLFQGEEELKGEAMDAARARAIYDAIVRRHRDPALIELAGHGLIRARVFPIGPGETRRVVLRYTQVLGRAGDALQFRFVAGTAPRAAGPPARLCFVPMPCMPTPAPLPQGSMPPRPTIRDAAPVTFTLVADDAGRFGAPFSPTHELRVSRERDRLIVRPAGELRGSVDVFLPLATPNVGITLAAHRVGDEEGYFMLTLSPGQVRATREPRDVAVAIDVSGSMAGEKMEQARQALHRLLGTLGSGDRFRLIAFSTGVDAFRPAWTAVSPRSIEEASGWIDQLFAHGGTNIAGALDELFRLGAGEGRLHLAVFVTDGLPTVGETHADRIAAAVEARQGEARVFVFGVGYDLNTYLLERLAAAGRGTVDYVRPNEDVEAAVGALALRLSHPVLVDLRFGGAPVRLTEVQPARLPDLYAGQELVVFGRYAGTRTARGELSVTGRRGGRDERFAAVVEFPEHSTANAYIPALWAARRLGELTRTMQLEGVTEERVAEARALALRYGLVSEYTSYLVQEPGGRLQTFRGQPIPVRALPAPGAGSDGLVSPLTPARQAVESASLAGRQRLVQSTVDLAAFQEPAAAAEVQPDGHRLVAGRRFRQVSPVWIDVSHAEGARIVHIEPFGPAYIDLLTRLPELHAIGSAFDQVIVAGARVSIQFGTGGVERLGAADMQALVNDFRGAAR